MSIGITIIVCSLCYLFVIIYSFFSKKRVNSLETKIYAYMLIMTIITLFLELSSLLLINFFPNLEILGIITTRALFIGIIAWASFLTAYIYVVTFIQHKPDKVNSKPFPMKIAIPFLIVTGIFSILMMIFPMTLNTELGFTYSTGFAHSNLSMILILYVISWLFCVMREDDSLKNRKYLPILVFIICIIITIIVKTITPSIFLLNAAITYYKY